MGTAARAGTGAVCPARHPCKKRLPGGCPGMLPPNPPTLRGRRLRLGSAQSEPHRQAAPPAAHPPPLPASFIPILRSFLLRRRKQPPAGGRGCPPPPLPPLQPQRGRGAVMLQGDPRVSSGVSPSAGCRDLPARRRRPQRQQLRVGNSGGRVGGSPVAEDRRRCPTHRG